MNALFENDFSLLANDIFKKKNIYFSIISQKTGLEITSSQ